jgi:hypothetical protein
MAWGRLHDQANANAKLLALSDAAWRMWGCGLIYCQCNLTDGFIPEHAIHTFGVRARNKEAVAEELCRVLVPGKASCWHKVDGGYQVHDYLDWNDSRDDVLEGRQRARDRLTKHRTKRVVKRVSDAVVNEVQAAFRDGFSSALEMRSEQGPTYHDRTCTNQDLSSVRSTGTEKQEHAPSAFAHSVETVENSDSGQELRVLLLRRMRSRETVDGRPSVKVIAALARHVLLRQRSGTDDVELREILKTACAKANLHYDGASVGDGLELAKAHLRRRGLLR